MKGKVQKGVKANQTLGGDFYSGGNSNVASEAKNKAEGFKRGGKTMKAKGRMMGGETMKSSGYMHGGKTMKVEGDMAKMNAGRKPRKSGGGVMSTAAKGSMRPGFDG